MTDMLTYLKILIFAGQLGQTFGVPPARAWAHASAAHRYQTSNVSPELIAAIASKESTFETWPVSIVRGKRFCGPMQAMAGRSVSRCTELANTHEGYRAGVEELKTWLRTCRGNVACALRAHACGNIGVSQKVGRCASYAAEVLRRARLLGGRLISSS